MDQHTFFMQRALELARQAEGFTSPNPAVGAVVVKDGIIAGEGYHTRAGTAHAEVEALHAAGDQAKGATLYVTLEPCNHHGRTPPCTEAIIQAGIAEVFYAVDDPNPRVAGQGARRLREADIRVQQGPCAEEVRHLNRFFFHFIRTGRPYLIAKFAVSLDGKIATRTGESQWITSTAARQAGHTLRHLVDAILIGAGTAIADNPQLTTRLSQERVSHPLRIVLDSRGRVPLESRLFQSDLPGRTLAAATEAMPQCHRYQLEHQNIEILILPATSAEHVDIPALLTELGQRQLTSLLVEGGGSVLGSCFELHLVNEVWAFLAPCIIGGTEAPGPVGGSGFTALKDICRLQNVTVQRLDSDLLVQGVIH